MNNINITERIREIATIKVLGFYAKDAQRVIMQTMKGAVDLLTAGGLHPEMEIDKVTTPGGLTIRGLNAMEEAGFTQSVIKGLRASVKK